MAGRRARIVVTALALVVLLLAASALVASAAPSPRPLKYACASDLYGTKAVLRYVAKPSRCRGAGHTLVDFTRPGLVFACRKKGGTPRGTVPKAARRRGPVGLMRMVPRLDDCKPPGQPNETPITLPGRSKSVYCAARKGGELRSVRRAKACARKEFPVSLRRRTVADIASANPGAGNEGSIVATPDRATTDEHSPVTIGVIANDTVPGVVDRRLTVASTDTSGTAGAVTVNPGSASITYSPNGKFASLKAGQSATDTFRYRATDGPHTSTPATVTVTIIGTDGAPVANDDSADTDEDYATNISVLANDADPDDDPLTVGSLDLIGTRGAVTVGGDNRLAFDPTGRFDSLQVGQTATDTFRYSASDGGPDSNAATVRVTISGRNDAPVLSGVESTRLGHLEGSAATPVSAAITVADPDNANMNGAVVRITNGYDAGHDALDFSNANGITGSSVGAQLTLTGTASKANYEAALRSVGFRSSGGASGDRDITFQVDDGSASSNLSNIATRTVTVDKAPVAKPDSATVGEDSGAGTIDVRANDTDSDGGPKTIAAKTDGTNGAVAITNGGDDLTYTPGPDFCGSDSFTYTLNGGSHATVSVTVSCVNDGPVNSVPEAQAVDEDATLTFTPSPSVRDIDAGAGGLQVTLSVGHGTLTLGATSGLIFTAGDGTADATMTFTGTVDAVNAALTGLSYRGDKDYNGPDTLTLLTDDMGNSGAGGSKSDSDAVAITVTPVKDPPAAQDDSYSTSQDTPLSEAAPGVLANDSDADGDTLQAVLVSGPASADSFALNPDGSFDYTPVAGYSGPDSFTYKANDGTADSEVVTVSLTVDP